MQNGVNHWTAIAEQFREAQSLLSQRKPRRVLTAGGDCACDIAVIDYLHSQYPKLTVLWIDAHLDANTTSTSPSGNFHGMPVSAIMGFAPPDLQALLAAPLPPDQFLYAAANVGDDGDWGFQRDKELSWLESGQSIVGPVHVHFDLDVLDPSEFPHVAYPDGSLSMESGLDLVRKIASSSDLVGLTITEFAPVDDVAANDGSGFIRRLIEAATIGNQ